MLTLIRLLLLLSACSAMVCIVMATAHHPGTPMNARWCEWADRCLIATIALMLAFATD
jgi:hypothetical protein